MTGQTVYTTPLQRQINVTADDLVRRAEGLRMVAGATDRGANATALSALEWTAALRADLDDLETSIVHQARVEGASWGEVADPIGITRLGAQQRWA